MCYDFEIGTSSGASANPYNNNQASGGYAGAGSGYVAGYAATDLAGMYGAAAAAYSSARSVAAAASASALHKVASAAKTKSRSNAGKTDISVNSPQSTYSCFNYQPASLVCGFRSVFYCFSFA